MELSNKKIDEKSVFEIVNEILSNILELDKSLKLILDYSCKFLQVKQGVLLLFNQNRKKIKIKSTYGYAGHNFPNISISLDESISEWIVKYKKTVIIKDIGKDEVFSKLYPPQKKNILSVPLKINEDLIGIINFSQKINDEDFDLLDINLIEIYIKQVMTVIDSALDEEYTTQIISDLFNEVTTLYEISEKFYKIDNMEELCKTVVEITGNVLNVDMVFISLLDEKSNTLKLINSVGVGIKDIGDINIKDGVTGHVARTGHSAIINDIYQEPQFKQIKCKWFEKKSYMCVPLETRDKIIGTLSVGDKSGSRLSYAYFTNLFTEGDRKLLYTIADQTAAVIENIKVKDSEHHLKNELYEKSMMIDEKQNQLLQSEKLAAVGQLSTGIAHEFNNILAIIYGNAQALLSDQYEGFLNIPDEDIDIVGTIIDEVKRGKDIVKRIGEFAKPQKLKLRIYDIKDIIQDILKFQKRFLEFENINIETCYSHKSKLNIDKNQLKQVFVNLINNACHAIKPIGKGAIHITTKETDNKIEIRLRDTGIGMDNNIIKNIFSPFFTTKGAYSKDDFGLEGLGLGLTVSYQIVLSHNGFINVESKQGVGTTFTITLPVEEAGIEKLEVRSGKLEVGKEKLEKAKELKILLIDDEVKIISTLSRTLKKRGYKDITITTSGEEALAGYEKGKYDVVFLDKIMPGMDGVQTLKEIKKIDNDVPVVFITGSPTTEMNTIDPELGVYDVINKPFEFEEIFAVLYKIAAKKKGRSLR